MTVALDKEQHLAARQRLFSLLRDNPAPEDTEREADIVVPKSVLDRAEQPLPPADAFFADEKEFDFTRVCDTGQIKLYIDCKLYRVL